MKPSRVSWPTGGSTEPGCSDQGEVKGQQQWQAAQRGGKTAKLNMYLTRKVQKQAEDLC